MRRTPIEKNIEAIHAQLARIEADQKKLDALIARRKQLLRKLGIPVKASTRDTKPQTERDITKVEILRHLRTDDYRPGTSDLFNFTSFPITIGRRNDSDIMWDEDKNLKGEKIFFPRHGYLEVVGKRLNYICLVDPTKNQIDLDVDDHIIFGDEDYTLFVITIRDIIRALTPSIQPGCGDTKPAASCSYSFFENLLEYSHDKPKAWPNLAALQTRSNRTQQLHL